MTDIPVGTQLKTFFNINITVKEKIGEGGQGAVYKVSYNNKDMALKWYNSATVKNLDWFYNNLQNNIKKGAPTKNFLWPKDLTEWKNGSFGYIMDLIPTNYKSFSSFLLAKSSFSSASAMVESCLNIVNGFRELHLGGYTYQDLNDGNFFINPSNGDVLICDNDNVSEFGTNSGIGGKSRYMAPLIVLGRKAPDKVTDRFSMAVILFLLLVGNHPLEGQAIVSKAVMTEAYQKKLYGESPVFIADKNDASNRPVKDIHNNFAKRWPILPSYIQDLFYKAFDKDTMAERKAGPLERDWNRALLQFKADIVECPNCNKTTLFNKDNNRCLCCGKPITPMGYIQTKYYNIPILPKQKICINHALDDDKYTNGIFAEIKQNKNDHSIYGIKNTSDYVWKYYVNGIYKDVEVGKTIQILKDTSISFNKNTIKIV